MNHHIQHGDLSEQPRRRVDRVENNNFSVKADILDVTVDLFLLTLGEIAIYLCPVLRSKEEEIQIRFPLLSRLFTVVANICWVCPLASSLRLPPLGVKSLFNAALSAVFLSSLTLSSSRKAGPNAKRSRFSFL